MQLLHPQSKRLFMEYSLGEPQIKNYTVRTKLGAISDGMRESYNYNEKNTSGNYFHKYFFELPENDFIDIVNIESFNPLHGELVYTIQFKNLDRVPEGEARMVHFFFNRYFLKKNGYKNGNANNINHCDTYTQTVILANRGDKPARTIRYDTKNLFHTSYNPTYTMQHNSLMKNVELSLDNYDDFLKIYTSKKKRGLIIDVPIDPNKPKINIGSKKGQVKDTYKVTYGSDAIYINDNLEKNKIEEKSNEPPFTFKVEKRGSKYYLLARARENVESIEPIDFWQKVDDRTYQTEIDHNGTFGASFPNNREMSSYKIDFFGTGKEPVQGWNTGKSSVKAGEPAPINPESPIISDPSSPATPTNPSTPAPIDPESPILPKPPHPTTPIVEVTPKETPETTLVIDDTKKKPYDPTFLIVSGIFATAIIFGE